MEHLTQLQALLEKTSIAQLFEQSPQRAEQFSCTAADLFLDYSKNRLDQPAIDALLELADSKNLPRWIKDLFEGAQLNHTEQRAALHTLLRCPPQYSPLPELAKKHQQVQAALEQMSEFVGRLHQGEHRGFSRQPIKTIINLGIGGSDLGPAMVVEALRPYHHPNIDCHFISNVDPAHLQQVLQQAQAETTLFIISSKSFGTQETLANARAAKTWLEQAGCTEKFLAQHFVAVTANTDKALKFGITKANIFPLWDWVGGRFSLWSAIGLPIALSTSMECFVDLLAGGHEMDQHFKNSPFSENMPVILALLAYWHSSVEDHRSQAILPYDQSLSLFPNYLQQLEMESNGKSVHRDGSPLENKSCPVIWGSVGTNSQHSFHQLLHQGTQTVPADFILPLQSHYDKEQHKLLAANCFAQSRALMLGKDQQAAIAELLEQGLTNDEAARLAPHKIMPGNRPSNTITMTKLSAKTLGALIALYEHKVFVQSVLWDVNPFDQWGVELGKQLCDEIAPALSSQSAGQGKGHFDSSTEQLIQLYQQCQ